MTADTSADALSLLTAKAVRTRAHRLLEIGLNGQLRHFRVNLGRLDAAVDLVLATTRRAYPAFDVPFHSRWRHFVVGGVDRWAALADVKEWRGGKERARAEFDLAIVSVLLDAGAGPSWRYRDPSTGARIGRSEGLALASLDMFARGVFSAKADEPLRADATALGRLTVADLRTGFQIADDNPLVGLEGRVGLLRRLGEQVSAAPQVFAREDTARPGGLFDHLAGAAEQGLIEAPTILSELLRQLGPIWPSRITLGGIPLGDCWRHPALKTEDATSELVPLHKLSQWLSYSLIEPMQRAGLQVTDIDGLTGLAEYRNGGLFVDAGVLEFRDPADAQREHDVASALVVEWRALTVALLDRLADLLRQCVGLDAVSLPLAKILEGGTWAAGRAMAFERRPDGSPPVKVVSDGTVF
ncbi:uracil phosphoribosyltransferase [Bradyrhizobium jicamae]|uniref:Uracil phosphoribosyltransferase n=1 Tax=Bradyrhizobium jicamae TaxID=280332 RepID=A0A0R3LDP2_9BRAD|nr:URC4/urg3 family protein [Bradyrhizobium jicamae]KRR05956.1 uracil phosphoribosyltransferase [Bradyrhizobium jicamae]